MKKIVAGQPLMDFFSKFPAEQSERELSDKVYPFRVCCAVVKRRLGRFKGDPSLKAFDNGKG